jgi:hypothetical protein
MILTFEQIKANALNNYKPTPKVEFVEVKDYQKLERCLTIIGLAVATVIIFFGIIF